MSQHSPGPWAVGGWKSREIKHEAFDNNSNPLARVYARLGELDANGNYTWRDDEADANARLIAAAPSLLAACEAILASFHSSVTTDESIESFPALAQVRDAIAEATGVAR